MSRILPRFLAKFEALGVPIPEEIFSSDKAILDLNINIK